MMRRGIASSRVDEEIIWISYLILLTVLHLVLHFGSKNRPYCKIYVVSTTSIAEGRHAYLEYELKVVKRIQNSDQYLTAGFSWLRPIVLTVCTLVFE